jgi:DNA invertase Pin-like site-specific DNA recombinase
MRVIGYIRVSSKGQMDGDGPQRQLDAIQKFNQAHNLSMGQYIMEDGVSGTVEAMNRDGFADMIVMIERESTTMHPIQAVVVERMDRLARDLMVSEILLTELRKRGIKVFATDQGALIDIANDEGDPTRKLIRQIIAALAEWEKSQLVLKLRVARNRKKAMSGRCEGSRPYGQTGNERQDLIEQKVLEMVRAWKKAGYSLSEIAALLNEGGFKNRRGTPWNKKNVFYITQTQKKGKCK